MKYNLNGKNIFYTQQSAFTLIELLMVILIIAILSAIVYPSYKQYVLKARRSDAKSALMRLAVAQEKFYNQHLSYSADLVSANGLNNQSNTSTDGFYQLSVSIKSYSVDGEDSFNLKAQAIGAQVNDSDCAKLSLNNLNQRQGYTAENILNTKCWL